jgi:hypothetical protein
MSSDLCWFEHCRERGALVDIDAAHPRILCTKHETGIRRALERPGTYRVSWGRSRTEKVQALADEMDGMEAELAALPPDPVVDWDKLAETLDDDEWHRLRYSLTDREVIESRIEACESRLSQINEQPWEDPVVRVGVVTQEATPRESAGWKPPA